MNDKTLTPIPEVKDLLQVLYKEANGSLDDLRESFSLGSCKRETICEALGYLKQLKFALRKDNADVGVSSQKDMKVSTLSKKFFECIPHSKTFVLDLKGVAQKMDMCQVNNLQSVPFPHCRSPFNDMKTIQRLGRKLQLLPFIFK